MHALLCVQCFPPLVKNAGGVAKDNLALCRALIDGLGWRVTLLTPVKVRAAGEADVERWLSLGSLRHVPAWAVLASTPRDGIATFLDLLSVGNVLGLVRALCCGSVDVCIIDDLLFRGVALLLARALGVPTIATTHTDVAGHAGHEHLLLIRLAWRFHVLSAHLATTHATVSRVYADVLRRQYRTPVHATWPPHLWSREFSRPPEDVAVEAARERARWTAFLGYEPRALLLYAGRWSPEKRIHLLDDAIPAGCALVIVGDGDTDYADEVEETRRRDVLPLRRMLGAAELRAAYAACDLLVSASRFETLGNAVHEALCAGTPVAVQPAQGHLELVEDQWNSYLVDFDDAAAARQRLEEIVAAGPAAAVQPGLQEAPQTAAPQIAVL